MTTKDACRLVVSNVQAGEATTYGDVARAIARLDWLLAAGGVSARSVARWCSDPATVIPNPHRVLLGGLRIAPGWRGVTPSGDPGGVEECYRRLATDGVLVDAWGRACAPRVGAEVLIDRVIGLARALLGASLQ